MKYFLLLIIGLSLSLTACKKTADANGDITEKTEEDEPIFEEEDLKDLYEDNAGDKSVLTEEEYDDRSAYNDEDDRQKSGDIYDDIKKEVQKDRVVSVDDATRQPTRNTVDELSQYLVVAGNFSQKYNADDMVKRLKAIGVNEAQIVYFVGREYHTVSAGYFDELADAKERVSLLKSKSYEAYVHKRTAKKR